LLTDQAVKPAGEFGLIPAELPALASYQLTQAYDHLNILRIRCVRINVGTVSPGLASLPAAVDDTVTPILEHSASSCSCGTR
jgi:hypothetical protein